MPIKQIQVAGIKTLAEAQRLLDLGVNLIGFPLRLPVHAPDISENEAAEIISKLGKNDNCVLIEAIIKVRPAAVDVHTGVEARDGSKDPALVAQFVAEARRGFARGKNIVN